MANKVHVRSVDTLQSYTLQLAKLREDLLKKVIELNALSEELRTKSSEMNGITDAQAGNWHDPQYEKMKNAVEPCSIALSINANSMNETASFITQQMDQVESSVNYLRILIRKLRA